MGLLLHVCALNDNCVRLLWGDDLCARAPVGAFAATAARRDRPGGLSSARAEIRQPYRALSARWQVFKAQTPYKPRNGQIRVRAASATVMGVPVWGP